MNSHIKRLETDGWLVTSGVGKGKKYFVGEKKHAALFSLTDDFSEDFVWKNHYSFIVEGLSENIIDICHYGF